jgi:hypothetical protein
MNKLKIVEVKYNGIALRAVSHNGKVSVGLNGGYEAITAEKTHDVITSFATQNGLTTLSRSSDAVNLEDNRAHGNRFNYWFRGSLDSLDAPDFDEDVTGEPGQLRVRPDSGYSGYGRAWAAVDEKGFVVAIKYMGDYYATPEQPTFGDYRLACRAELADKGEVVSGTCSCRSFYLD